MASARQMIVKALQATKMNKLAHKVYYRHIHGFDTIHPEILSALERAFQAARERGTWGKGDYCEFGIFKGYAFWYAQQQAGKNGDQRMRFFGFDSFAGLPEIDEVDQTKESVFYQGQYECSREKVESNLNSKGVDWDRTQLIEGFFDQSLQPELRASLGLDRMAIGLIDCDLFSSTRDVLGFIDSLLMDGTILLFDDWNCFDRDDNRGQRKAFREYLEARPHLKAEPLYSYGDYGQVFCMTGLSDAPDGGQ